MWFRNTWSWGRDDRRPQLRAVGDPRHRGDARRARPLLARRATATRRCCSARTRRTPSGCAGQPNSTPFPKDGINDHVVRRRRRPSTRRSAAPKARRWYRSTSPAGRSRAHPAAADDRASRAATRSEPTSTTSSRTRRDEADEFYDDARARAPPGSRARRAAPGVRRAAVGEEALPLRRARSGWRATRRSRRRRRPRARAQQRAGRTSTTPTSSRCPTSGSTRGTRRGTSRSTCSRWRSSTPTSPRTSCCCCCREWYMHPNGQLPAYEWAFDDVNPPVHAWAAWRVYKIDAAHTGKHDCEFLERVFHKLLINFTWWVNRKDADGQQRLRGRLPRARQHRPVRPSARRCPTAAQLEQSDATAGWRCTASTCSRSRSSSRAHDPRLRGRRDEVLRALPRHRRTRRTTSAATAVAVGRRRRLLLRRAAHAGRQSPSRCKVRSMVGLIPLFAVETFERRCSSTCRTSPSA